MTQTLCELEKARGELPHLLDAALQEEEVIIIRQDGQKVRLVSVHPGKSRRQPSRVD